MTQKAEPTHEDRVRLKAYEIWLNEGRPEGRDERHWAMARELIGYDDAHRSTLVPAGAGEGGESKAFKSQGAAPSAIVKGESQPGPSRDAAKAGPATATPSTKKPRTKPKS